MAQVVICGVEELPPGSRRIVDVEGRSIGVFNVRGRYYAIRNACPHRGAPLCLGLVGGTMLPSDPHTYRYGRDAEVLRCPWHGWEIDLATGRPLFDPERAAVKTYDVEIVDGAVVIDA